MNSDTAMTKTILLLLPSLRMSGGVKEAIRLAEDLTRGRHPVQLIVLWKSKYELPCTSIPVRYLSSYIAKRSLAGLQFPLLLIRFLSLLRERYRVAGHKETALILTHFSTFPFAWIAPRHHWYCFNQDVEWMFVKPGLRRRFLRRFILATSRRSRVLTTNAFVESLYREEGVQPIGELSIWADLSWRTSGTTQTRDIDVVMLLRRGFMKRLDLYLELISQIRQTDLVSCAITPDEEIHAQISHLCARSVLSPSDEELKTIYQRSKVFLLLSDTEGFGLPPLEAMGSGCVPLCRDSGGPRCYMTGPLAANLIPLDAPPTEVLAILQRLLLAPEELPALSDCARATFSAGYESSLVKRSDCLIVLSETLRMETSR